MAFKQDEDFLRFLTMGAIGTREVAADLVRRGHRIAELERYSMANKLWATKIKRLRLPDLICLTCGLRVEAKAKSKLEIKLSHSETPGREWDAGLRDADLVAFVQCETSGSAARAAGNVEYFHVEALRSSVELASLGPPKAASAGAERDLKWPAIVPGQSGTVRSSDDARASVEFDSGRSQAYANRWGAWHVYAAVGTHVAGNVQFLAGPVARPVDLSCPGTSWDPIVDLTATDPLDRYAAVKASGLLGLVAARGALSAIAANSAEDARIRLEATGALARLENGVRVAELAESARDADLAQGLSLEAIFILSELATDDSARALESIAADASLPDDARAAAAWGLGVTGASRPDLLLQFISDANEVLALHAIAALPAELPPDIIKRLQAAMEGTDREAAIAGETLARQGDAGIDALLDAAAMGGSGRSQAIIALGRIPRSSVERVGGARITPDVSEALEPLWQDSESNWTRAGDNTYQLALLDRQAVR